MKAGREKCRRRRCRGEMHVKGVFTLIRDNAATRTVSITAVINDRRWRRIFMTAMGIFVGVMSRKSDLCCELSDRLLFVAATTTKT